VNLNPGVSNSLVVVDSDYFVPPPADLVVAVDLEAAANLPFLAIGCYCYCLGFER